MANGFCYSLEMLNIFALYSDLCIIVQFACRFNQQKKKRHFFCVL